MRKPLVAVVLLVLLALVPIGAWVAMAASLDPVGLGRSIGMAILVVTSPFAIAGLLMIGGAAIFNRTRRAGRVVATVGAAIAGIGGVVVAAFWLERVGRCVEGSSFCTDRLVEGGGLLLYAVAHAGLIVLIWRARRGELSSAA
jgi:high-affinity K+ transport system ATPase subunit B